VFLDRDGVITRADVRDGKPFAPMTFESLEILAGVHDALQRLAASGYLLIVATNQPDVGHGRQAREVVERMHRHLRRELPLTDIRTCYHAASDGCTCRKPRPGMLLDAAKEANIDLGASYMVGDRWRDVGAGRAAGCFTIFIDRGYREPVPDTPDAVCTDLGEAVTVILAHAGGR
jgi:D-glycero-D-manno-heptose 1,7-bisphosphate phosphatase